jgi:transposase InsO family protein
VRPAARREVAGHLQVADDISERRACQASGFGRSSQRYRKRSDPQVALRMRLKELAAARVHYGYRRLPILLRREGWEVNHPWTNGQVERMNRTIEDATVKRYHYDSHAQLRTHLQLFVDAYNHARRLKTLRGLTPTEFILDAWTREPNRFRIDPPHLIPGLYI